MKRAPLSRGAYRCLKAIKSYDFQRRGWSCPSHDTLAKDLRVNVSSIKRYVAELKGKYYLSANRRPNSSSIYHFGLRSAQNEPAVGSKNEPAGEPAGEPTIHLILKQHNSTPAPTPRKEPTVSQMPEMYASDPIAQKLWRMAQRWIAINAPDLSAITGDKARPIMYALEEAGAIAMDEDGPLPAITLPGDRILADQVMTNEANRDPRRKPMGVADADLRTLRRRINGTD